MAHAKKSPSSSKRWMNCPGSLRLCADIPDESNEAADDGTYSHEIAESCLTRGNDAASMLGMQSTCGRFVLDEERAEHIQLYLDTINLARMVHGGELHVERRVEAVAGVWGTSDAILWSPGRLDVWDLKYGAGVYVDPRDPQGWIYACGALVEFDMPADAAVHIHIVQPRHRADPKVRTCSTTAGELRAWRREVLHPASVACDAPDAPLKPGDWCTFCPAKPTCPARREQTLAITRLAFGVAEPEPQQLTPTPPDQIPIADLARLARSFDAVEEWITAARKHLHQKANDGVPVPGWKLVQSEGNRVWRDEAEAAKALKAIGVEPYEEVPPPEPKLMSPNKAETHLKGKEHAKTRKAIKLITEKHTHKPLRGAVLVPEDNPRPQVDKAAPLKQLANFLQ